MSELEKAIEVIVHRTCLDLLKSERSVSHHVQTEWMTETQLAEYWQLRANDGELTVHSIRKWTARPANEYPLPCGNMGELRRYHRTEVDQWAREEAARQRAKHKQNRLRVAR